MLNLILAPLTLICLLSTVMGCKPQGREHVDIVDFSVVGGWQPEDLYLTLPVVEIAKAIQRGDLTEINRLLASGVDVNSVGKDGVSLLGWSLMVQNRAAYQILLEQGADVNALMLEALPLIELVAKYKADPEWLEIALKYGGNPNVQNRRANRMLGNYLDGQETPIFSAIINNKKPNFDLLVRAGANLNYRNLAGRTPLLEAAVHRSFEYVYYLLLEGADFQIQDNLGYDLAHYIVVAFLSPEIAAWQWREKAIHLLEAKGVDFNAASKKIRDSKEPRHKGLYERWEKRLKWVEEQK